jgi:hypothetical protein
VSPILVRPVREQFEHDRVIRVLQAKYKRKYEVVINPGAEQNASVSIGELAMFPDLVLFGGERGKKLQATVEVETTESINTLEAMAEWGPFGRLKTAFILYVPANSIDTARRLCTEHGVIPSEIWTYHSAMDQIRFTMVQRTPENARPNDGKVPRVTITRPPAPPEPRPSAPAPAAVPASGANGSEARAVAARSAPPKSAPPKSALPKSAPPKSAPPIIEKPKPVKKAAPPPAPPPRPVKLAKTAKTAKKAAKIPPRAAVARPRAGAKKAARKSPAKRSVSPKR